MRTEFAALPVEIKRMTYGWLGEKYNSQYGGLVLGWFVERHLERGCEDTRGRGGHRRFVNGEVGEDERAGGDGWCCRYSLYKVYLSRKVPQSTLFSILDRMVIDGVLEMDMEERGIHRYRLNSRTMGVLEAIAEFLMGERRDAGRRRG
ncbi:MAG: hypothetical protein J7L61_03910 [Thermoplasmata archaeon]|nr:hypothetical protein [Thermoplasmata archaeon]